MDTISGMRTYVGVVEAGSFTAAGERLEMSTALVSKYVAKLEGRLGVRLLNRTTRSLTLTEVGRVYFERCQQLLGDFDELESAIRDRHAIPSGKLVVTAPVTFGEIYLTPAVARFLERYSDVNIDLRLTDRFVALVDEGVDLAIRIAELADSSLIARRLAPARLVVCAAPAYLERYGVPSEPDELGNHACIIDTNLRTSNAWSFMIEGERKMIKVSGRFSVNSARASRAMILSGAGIGLIPTYAIGEDIKKERAVVLLESFEASNLGVYALYAHHRHLAAKVRAFIDFMLEEFGPVPEWDRF